MTHPILYKIGGRGQVLQWSIEVKRRRDDRGQHTIGVLVMEHGQKDGKLVIDKEVVAEGKNLGRKNATTPIQQAKFQAEARWKKQFDRYYRETIEEAEKAAKAKSKPMRAHKYLEKKDKHLKDGEEIALQPKLDGMRCLACKEDGEVVLMSNGGKVIESVPHIIKALEPLLIEGVPYDGELYVHGMNFDKIMSICRRGAKNLHEEHETMQLHVFDVVDSKEFVSRVTKRFAKIERAKLDCVQIVDTQFVVHGEKWDGIDAVEYGLKAFEDQGYEGVMVRKLNMPYEHKRSIQLLKLKSFQDEEFEIVDCETGTPGTDKEGLLQTFVLCLPDNRDVEFKAPLMGCEKLLREMWGRAEDYVGEVATVVFQEKTKRGVPRFPKAKGIRGKEDLSGS